MFDRSSLARCLPFAIYMGFIIVADGLERWGWGAAELRWLYPVKIVAVIAVLGFYWRSYRELTVARLSARDALVALLAGVLVFILWINLDAPWMSVGSPTGFDPRTDGKVDYWLVAVRLAGAALVVPVMEELFWRSFLLRWISGADFQQVAPRQVSWKGFIAVAVLFGVEHTLWLAGIVAGVVYGYLYICSRTLWSPVLAHAVTNGVLGVWIIATEQWTYW